MENLRWIKELVQAEQQMEETGTVDMSAGFDPGTTLESETIDYLRDLKMAFVEAASAFNQLRGTAMGHVKIYGISKTRADFMLFRNGYKLIFAMKGPGNIAVRFNHIGTSYMPGAETAEVAEPKEEDLIRAEWGAFGDLSWKFKDKPVRVDYMVRYYMTRFVRESAK